MTTPDYGEPWRVEDVYQNSITYAELMDLDGDPLCTETSLKRAAACVNACRGIPEPEKVVPLLVAAIKSLNASRMCYSADIDKAFSALGIKSVYDDFNVMAIEPKREG